MLFWQHTFQVCLLLRSSAALLVMNYVVRELRRCVRLGYHFRRSKNYRMSPPISIQKNGTNKARPNWGFYAKKTSKHGMNVSLASNRIDLVAVMLTGAHLASCQAPSKDLVTLTYVLRATTASSPLCAHYDDCGPGHIHPPRTETRLHTDGRRRDTERDPARDRERNDVTGKKSMAT